MLKFDVFFAIRLHSRSQFSHCKRFCSTKSVRVRFAPSPTGFLHLGGLRTVAFNYFFARSQNGRFILRIEDTDRKRFVPKSLESLERTLSWLGLTPDEGPSQGGDFGPYLQSQRLDLYTKQAQHLLEKNLAYRCFCSEDRLEMLRKEALKNRETIRYDGKCRHLTAEEAEQKLKSGLPHVIRFKIDTSRIVNFVDTVFGDYNYEMKEEGDFVIVKSDGYPTYHFANIVDDHHMKISHVLRGEEWLVSTAKHLVMYEAFGWTPPVYAHLPLMKGSQGLKLSKRDNAAFVEHYKQLGYYPIALINSVCSTGGGFKDRDKHKLYTMDELTKMLDMTTILRHGTRFELDWLNVYNVQVISQTNTKSLVDQMISLIRQKYGDALLENQSQHFNVLDDTYVEKVIEYGKNRVSTLSELMEKDLECFWTVPGDKFELMNLLLNEKGGEYSPKMLTSTIELLDVDWPAREEEFLKENIFNKTKQLAEKNNWKYPKYFKFLRAAINGAKLGPPINEMFQLLGRELVVKRLKIALENVNDKTKLNRKHA